MALIKQSCPSCGGAITVDDSQSAITCEYCASSFTLQVQLAPASDNAGANPTVDNLLMRANQFFDKKEYESAIEYYNKVLDLDAANVRAKQKLHIINNMIVFFEKRISLERTNKIISLLKSGQKKTVVDVLRKMNYSGRFGAHQYIECLVANNYDVELTNRKYQRYVSKYTQKANWILWGTTGAILILILIGGIIGVINALLY